jgi:putative transposase
MGRVSRIDKGDMFYHVINRANFRSLLFANDSEYSDFMEILKRALLIVPMRIIAYCLMPNHWHMVLYPINDGDLSKFMQWITLTHTQRYHTKTKTEGYGHIYQGRYKSFLIENDVYFKNVVRYVETNAQRAAFVARAEEWRWSSAYVRAKTRQGFEATQGILSPMSPNDGFLFDSPDDYFSWLNGGGNSLDLEAELQKIRKSVERSRPYGSESWMMATVDRFGLKNTLRDRGRPGKITNIGNGT